MRKISVFITILAMLASCTKASLEQIYSNQEGNIDRFITSEIQGHPEYTVVHNNGSNRLVRKPGEGPAATAGSKITLHYAAYSFERNKDDNRLVATNHEETVLGNSKWNGMTETLSFAPIVIDLSDKAITEGLRNGLAGVQAGEECYILFSGKYGFGKKPHGNVPGNSAMLYDIYVRIIE